MRYERHVTIIGLSGASCDACGRDLKQLDSALSTPKGESDVELLCVDCARERLEEEKERGI